MNLFRCHDKTENCEINKNGLYAKTQVLLSRSNYGCSRLDLVRMVICYKSWKHVVWSKNGIAMMPIGVERTLQ